MNTPRKRTKFQFCDHHEPMFAANTRRRNAETCLEGGWANGGACSGGLCRLWPGTDFYTETICHEEWKLDWTKGEWDDPNPSVEQRLAHLRQQIVAEQISYGEIAELADLAEHIDPADTLLLQWAGVPEFPEEVTA